MIWNGMLRQLSCLVSSVVGWEAEENSTFCPQNLLLNSRNPVQVVDKQRMQVLRWSLSEQLL